jgi:hypothetical protein
MGGQHEHSSKEIHCKNGRQLERARGCGQWRTFWCKGTEPSSSATRDWVTPKSVPCYRTHQDTPVTACWLGSHAVSGWGRGRYRRAHVLPHSRQIVHFIDSVSLQASTPSSIVRRLLPKLSVQRDFLSTLIQGNWLSPCLSTKPWRNIRGVEVKLHAFLTSALNENEGSISCAGRSTLREKDAGTHPLSGSVTRPYSALPLYRLRCLGSQRNLTVRIQSLNTNIHIRR